MKKSVVVVGAGIGGLCAAARLLKEGYQVTIYEKESMVGGRAHRIEKNGYKFDTGPTLLMMTDVLYDTFVYCGKDLSNYLELIQLEPNYKVTFADKTQITVSSNLPKFVAELAKVDSRAPEQFYKYFADVAAMYRLSRDGFIDKNFNSLRDFINLRSGAKLLRKRGLLSLWKFVSRYFASKHLRQLFSFQSMYLGVSPYEAPAVYSVVSYMETGLGIWYPKGGMYSLSQALERLVKDLGGKIVLDTPVEKITEENGKTSGIELAGTKKVLADIVLCNADLVYAYQSLLPNNLYKDMLRRTPKSLKQASSALLFYWGVDDECKDMLHHNVFLCKDFKNNLDEIFHQKVLPSDPSFYTYIPTKTDASLAPKNKNILYVLVPVANNASGIDWVTAQKTIRQQVLARLKSEYGLNIEKKIETEVIFTPQDFESKFNLPLGSAFGLTHHFFQSGYFRPHNYSTKLKNIYFVGASTYPGGGIPMVTLSAKLVVERILEDEQDKS